MKTPLLVLLGAAALAAAVDGTVVNGTTGKPQPGVQVALVAMSGPGMQPQGSLVTGPDGRFRFSQAMQATALLQATHQGVTYNLMIQPGTPATGLTLEVFNASARRGSARVIEDVVLLEPLGEELSVREHVIWRNDGKQTYHDPASGTFRFYAPPEARNTLSVSATAPGGLPVAQAAEAAGPPDVFKVDFAIKPGETNFEVTYRLPFTSPGAFSGRAVQRDAPVRLAAPQGVVLKGAGIEPLGQEPQSRASIYSVRTPEYTVQIEGSGSMSAAGAAGSEETDSGLSQILPRIYGSVYSILGLAFLILALGFALLYRKKEPVCPGAGPPASPNRRLRR